MSDIEKLKMIVKYNHKQLQMVNYDQNCAENLITTEEGGISIFDPFYDETLRFEVDPYEYYEENSIKEMINKGSDNKIF